MFPGPSTSASRPPRTLRGRLVRGLDVAVEFATLGEYGVEEIEVEAAEPVGCGWDWPPRCAGRPRTPVLPGRSRTRGGVAPACG